MHANERAAKRVKAGEVVLTAAVAGVLRPPRMQASEMSVLPLLTWWGRVTELPPAPSPKPSPAESMPMTSYGALIPKVTTCWCARGEGEKSQIHALPYARGGCVRGMQRRASEGRAACIQAVHANHAFELRTHANTHTCAHMRSYKRRERQLTIEAVV